MKKLESHTKINPSCCDEKIFDFLTLDHINQDGKEHRKSVQSKGMYKWIIDNDFPSGFTILCFNCNLARSFPFNKGICPHKKVI